MSSQNTTAEHNDNSAKENVNNNKHKKKCVVDETDVVKKGVLRKFKGTRKRKFFVLRCETVDSSACLEYYDSEKRYIAGVKPKKKILLKSCFNINRLQDVKGKHVIALYTKDDCLCISLDSEEELESWLKILLHLQRGEEVLDGEIPKPTFEHVWHVQLMPRGLGNAGYVGNYSLCLTDKLLTLIEKSGKSRRMEFQLSNIRSCGDLKNFFFLEVGRSSIVGAGELWMDTTDSNIAHNIHSTVFHYMSKSREDLGPKGRTRSSSATESSKPSVRKQMILGMSKGIFNQDNPQTNDTQALPSTSSSSSQTQNPIVSGVASLYQLLIHRGASKTSQRRHSISGGINWSGHASHQRTQSLPITHPAPITNDHTPQNRSAKKPNQSSKCLGGGRERCDSMPSRARTTSEGNHPGPFWSKPNLIPGRPYSFYGHGRDLSHSPPAGSPVSPPSVTGSATDSAGSSYSLADDDSTEVENTLGRIGHSLTPDEAIAEEDSPDSPGIPITISPGRNNYIPMAPQSSDDGYVDMSPRDRDRLNMSPAASLSSVTSGTPSTDMRFAEYHLDKVSSYFFPSEDDELNSNERPPRAYSFGSKCEAFKFKKNYDNSTDNPRARAFSVGSKTKKAPVRVLPPHNPHPSIKSSSAPILTASKTSSRGSLGPMDDLMELDFSRSSINSSSGNVDATSITNNKRDNSGYVEMKPVRLDSLKTEANPYVDMTGLSPAKSFMSPQEEKSSNDLNRQYGRSDSKSDYMDMEGKKSRMTPVRCSTSPLTNAYTSNHTSFDYLDMSCKRSERTPSMNSQLSSSPGRNTVSPKCVQGSPWRSSDYMDMQGNNSSKTESVSATPQTPEGYVEMTLGKGHQRQSSLDSTLTNSQSCDDYMSLGGSSKKKDKKSSKKENYRSQPIMIQGVSSNTQTHKNSSPTSPLSNLFGRKHSTGTPPKMHLPLSGSSPYSSFPRQRSRKNSRRDSRDSSSSAVTTPSSSSATLFPLSLNSPSSPQERPAETPEEKPEAVTKKISITYKPTTLPICTVNNQTDDYTIMDFENNKTRNNPSDYVNFKPGPMKKTVPTQRSSEESDYAVMKAGVSRTTTPCAKTVTTAPLTAKLTSLTLNSNTSNCFRPISENQSDTGCNIHGRLFSDKDELPHCNKISSERPPSKTDNLDYMTMDMSTRLNPDVTVKTRPASVSSDGSRCNRSRPGSATSELCTCSSTSTLVGSRPESVNSDSMRPGSVSSESQLHYASLDLPPSSEEDGTRSPRTIKNSSEGGIKTQSEPNLTYAEIDFSRSQHANTKAN